MARSMIYDVIIVGGGPGGSSAATFLARRGLTVLILDKEHFPRDKVCGDGLVPQALYWIDKLGCIDEVLDQTNSCITSSDVYINGDYLLTGSFPDNSKYPHFSVLLSRKKLDHILLNNAISNGADFKPDCLVRRFHWHNDCIEVEAKTGNGMTSFKGRVVIGADGVNSIVSRLIGNKLGDGVSAVSLRTYYKNVKFDKSPIKIFFNKDSFPGYGWLFADDAGFANIGVGYALDKNFQTRVKLKSILDEFIHSDLNGMLTNAEQVGPIKGGSSSFYKPKASVADRVVLIGDAANQGDPMNGGGIHKAMESAYFASQTIAKCLSLNDFSQESLKQYEQLWENQTGLDWRTGELFLSIAKNPNLREVYVFLLKNIGKLVKEDDKFSAYCSGFFSGVISPSSCLSPITLLNALPHDPALWLSLLRTYDGEVPRSVWESMASFSRASFSTAGKVITHPLENLEWGVEVSSKVIHLLEQAVSPNKNHLL